VAEYCSAKRLDVLQCIAILSTREAAEKLVADLRIVVLLKRPVPEVRTEMLTPDLPITLHGRWFASRLTGTISDVNDFLAVRKELLVPEESNAHVLPNHAGPIRLLRIYRHHELVAQQLHRFRVFRVVFVVLVAEPGANVARASASRLQFR